MELKYQKGDVVALIGDFEPESIATLLTLLDIGAIVVPLTKDTIEQHEYFIDQSHTQHVFEKIDLGILFQYLKNQMFF